MKDISGITPKRILVCQLRQIGDVLLATPSVRLLKEKYPEAEIDFLTEKKCTQVLENNPDISFVWALDRKALANPLRALAYYSKVGRAGYDLVIDFQQLPRCKLVSMLSNADVKLSHKPAWYDRWIYTNWTNTPLKGYAAQAKARVLEPLGIEWAGEAPKIWLSDSEREEAGTFHLSGALSGAPFITVDPSHRRITRRWPARHYSSLIKLLHSIIPEHKFLVLYGPGEKALADAIALNAGEMAIVPEDMLSLRGMAAVMERADLHIGNCSAPRHFAVAVDTPSLTMHGATSTAWRFPSGKHLSAVKRLDCQFCNKNSCEDIRCLNDLLPEEVLPLALQLLGLPAGQ